MIRTVDFSDFLSAFISLGRADTFSFRALRCLFDYLEDVFPEYDLDVIALCCEYAESTLDELNDDYSRDFETLEDAAEWLNRETIVVGIADDTIVYLQF